MCTATFWSPQCIHLWPAGDPDVEPDPAAAQQRASDQHAGTIDLTSDNIDLVDANDGSSESAGEEQLPGTKILIATYSCENTVDCHVQASSGQLGRPNKIQCTL